MSTDAGLIEGLVHAHSDYSYDAEMSYADLRAFLLARGFRFACMTEHIEHLAQADIDAIIDACRSYSDEEFLFVPGIEMDYFVIYFLGIQRTAVDFENHRTVFDSLHRNASMCVFAHPIKANFEYPSWLIERCDGVEVLNTKHDGQHYLRPQSERLYRRVLRQRPHAVALAGMDFHGPKLYTDVRLRLTREGPLTETFVLQALREGWFQIVKSGRPFDTYGALHRSAARARIHLMDLSHRFHRELVRRGFTVPPWVKRRVRKLMEGG